jgi:DNA polymerase-3 subunit alpha
MIETEQDKREGRENPVKRLMDYAGKIEGLLGTPLPMPPVS